jgi:hypothetical protein
VTPATGPLLKSAPLHGTPWTASLYAAVRFGSGRRVVVYRGGRPVWDSGECRDGPEAERALAGWLGGRRSH